MNRLITHALAALALGASMAIGPAQADDVPLGDAPSSAPTSAPTSRASQRSSTTRTTRPASGPASALPPEFAVLQTLNGFARGRAKSAATSPAGPEANFALKGIADVGSRLTAFVEDIKSKNVVQAATGDSIARGRIKRLDLDSIEYEVAGETRRIEVGQNLNGEVVPPTPTSKPAGGDKGDKGDKGEKNPAGPAPGAAPEGAGPPPGAPGEAPARRPRPTPGG